MLLGLPWTSMDSLAQWLEPYLLPDGPGLQRNSSMATLAGVGRVLHAYRALGVFQPSTSLVSGLLPVVLSIWLMAF